MSSYQFQVRIVLHPFQRLRAEVGHAAFEKIEGDGDVAELRVGAGCIVLRIRVIWINSHGSGDPFPCTIKLPEATKEPSAELRRPGIFGVGRKFTLGELEASSSGS